MPSVEPSLSSASGDRVADAAARNWVDRSAPAWLKPYARVARWDRPIGFWLLFWPCAFSLALAALANPAAGFDWRALILMLVSKKRAALFLLLQLLVGVVIVFQFNWPTIGLCVASLVLVVIYPFMKRITWWPQLFLGLAFSWGALVGWSSQTGGLAWPPVLLYVGCILWVIGYDTIYAVQDIEDDALVGVKSTARLFGDRVKPITGLFYVGALVFWLVAGVMAGGGPVFAVLLLVCAGILGWQVWTLDVAAPGNALRRFKSNHWVGLALTVALLADVWT
jgi:4-hydroxybenzoate polyprenyltransferase